MSFDRWPTRRTVLGTAASGVTLALAGCLGDDSDDTDDDDGSGDADSSDGTDGADETDGDDTGGTDGDDGGDDAEALDSPAEFPEDEECAVCGMVPAEHPEWNAQLVTASEDRVYFCSSGCLLAYTVDPVHFGGEDVAIENAWVTDYETGALVDGMGSHYVRVEDSDHVDDIMKMNPTPFESRDDAEAFVDTLNEEHDTSYDSETDIISFDDFDMDLAMLYRGQFFEDDGGDGQDGDHD